MANVAKKRTVVVAGGESPSPAKQQTVPRQRGIPTRVHRNDDRKLDLNRNSRPSSLTNFADREFCDNAVDQSQDSELDNENGKRGKGAILKPGSCLSVPFKVLRRTNSPKRSLESDNRSQLAYLLSSCNNNDTDKSVDKGKSTAAIDSSKSRLIYKQNFECPHSSVVNHSASYHNPSKSSHSKPLHVRKSLDSGSQVKRAVFTKEMISLSADHLALQDAHGTDPGVEMTSSISSVISDPVKKPSLKQNSADVLSNGMTSPSTAYGKRSLRSRSEMSKSETRSNLRPRSSGPVTVSHHKITSGDRSPLRKDSRKQSVNKKSSEISSMDPSEGELGVGKQRKNSGNTGQRTLECAEQDERPLHVSGIQKVHFSARNQSLPTDLGGKFGRMTRNQKAEVNSIHTFRKGNLQSQESGAKCSSAPKIHISHEPSAPESRQVIALSDLVNHSDIPVTCKTSESLENDGEACQAEQSFCDSRALEEANSLNGCMFHSHPHKATGLDRQEAMISHDNVSDHSGNFCNHCDEEQHSADLQDVVLDANTFQQMIDELKALKLTVLHLQRLLYQCDTGENSLCENDLVTAYHGLTGNVQAPAICQENCQLQRRVTELEELTWEQKKMIDNLKQTLVELEINISPEIGNAASEAETVELTFQENCCLNNKHFQSSGGGQRFQNMRVGHQFVLLNDDGGCQPAENHMSKSPEAVFCSNEQRSDCNVKDIQLRHRCNNEYEKNSSQRIIYDNSEQISAAQRSRDVDEEGREEEEGEEEEWTVDCSMFDFNCLLDSDHDLDAGEPLEHCYSKQTESTDSRTPECWKATEILFSDKLIDNLVDILHYEDRMDFSLDKQENNVFKSLVSEESIKQITEPDENVERNVLAEHENHILYVNRAPNNNDYDAEHPLSTTDVNSEASRCLSRTLPNKTMNSSRSFLRTPKSYSNVRHSSVFTSLPDGCMTTVQLKTASLDDATMQSREIITSMQPSSRLHKASKLPASTTK